MAPIDKNALTQLLTNGQHRSLIGSKRLTLAFGGLYIATTTITAKPLLVWETESGYARYYVPIESVHPDIKSQLNTEEANGNGHSHSNGDQKTPVKLEITESVKGKGNDTEAVIERLSIGSRSTNWVRFVEGPLKGFVRFERDEIDQWFENGALFAGIKNPYKRIDTTPIPAHVVVKIDGEEVAESTVAVLLSETGLKEAYYLPATSIKNWGIVEKSDWKTVCPYKGESWYFNLTVKGKKHENAVWYYMYPTHESSGVEGLISFYNRDNVEILIDGVKSTELDKSISLAVSGAGNSVVPIVPSNHSLSYEWTR